MTFHDSYDSNQVADTYCNAELCFVQEEHKNMGAWSYVQVPLAHKNPRPNVVLSSSVLKLTSQLQPRTQTAIGGYHRLIQVHISNCFNNFKTFFRLTYPLLSISAATLHPPPPLEARPPTRRNFLHSSHRFYHYQQISLSLS